MTSLRMRLVAWYVSVAAIIVLFIALLANIAVFEVLSFEARQSLANASRRVPALVTIYEKSRPRGTSLEAYLRQELTPTGVLVHVRRMPSRGRPPMPRDGFRPGRLPPPPGERGLFWGPVPPQSLSDRLYASLIRPVGVSFPNGQALLVADPSRLQPMMALLWLVVGIFAVIVIGIAWRIALVVAEQTLEPLVRTTQALNRFGDGDFTPEAVRTSDRSEVGALAGAFNRAVEQITRAFAERSRTEAEMRQFVADAGHQLRTPLTVIMGHLSAMEAKAESPRQAMAYRSMLAQSRRMRALIDDLITLARLEHDEMRSDALLDMNELCARLPLCFDEPAQQRIGITPSSPAIFVKGDEGDLLGAFTALVDNALKYAPNGPIEITIARRDGECTIEVSDRGPGMNEADIRAAFDRFYRGGSADGVEGTGLGLSIVRKAVERVGGSVSLHSREGGGLVCRVSLPIHSVASSPRAASR
ncbi:MAG TPA: HAMP domain-containing sensor histidine kinase [Candidatus Acidoferrales bacterium]|nr:HAMP domain-containing sensor histidine kinase [Candidatus Acidoferrales bacterium]